MHITNIPLQTISLSLITILLLSILFHVSHTNLATAGSVPLLRIHSGNATLDQELPKFYTCIDQAVKHSVKKEKDPYFKTEPTKNEVIKCYYDNMANDNSGKLHKRK